MALDLPKFEQQIRKTGFVLEDQVSEALKQAGWSVISNRYYLDDTDEATVREIDLIAYRHAKLAEFALYTTLIISCKKSDDRVWALLCRRREPNDPNADWWPLHAWSNNKAIRYQLGLSGMAQRYHADMAYRGGTTALQLPVVDVFAFQEMDREKGTPQNDKGIFASITSLMKAQSYEMSSLPQRRKDPAVYQFNLISVVDADLVRLQFAGSSVHASEVASEHYIARYIIRKTPIASRIRFLRASHFPSAIADYDALHRANVGWFGEQHQAFYEGILKDAQRVDYLMEEFRRIASLYLSWRAERQGVKISEDDIGVEWRKDKDMPAVTLPIGAPFERLNADETLKKFVGGVFRRVFRYHGDFFFDTEELPF